MSSCIWSVLYNLYLQTKKYMYSSTPDHAQIAIEVSESMIYVAHTYDQSYQCTM